MKISSILNDDVPMEDVPMEMETHYINAVDMYDEDKYTSNIGRHIIRTTEKHIRICVNDSHLDKRNKPEEKSG